ncbi:unnamed protein product [Rotaria sordida]|uniref:Uncharacterized protein n=1 Tax=Rotaria sordida TaxID=392033 RepID=A0A814Z4D8_9BILA|nr:unnamed protein product [Rotaria sordida]CAF1521327.1 unnamed protein product [Rotaria sordida]
MTETNTCLGCNSEGIHTCAGCQGHFCTRDLTIHRMTLVEKLDAVRQDRNRLHQQVIQANQSNVIHQSLLSEIKKWYDTTVEKVRQAALKVRDEMNQLLRQNMENIKNELIEMAKQFPPNINADTILEGNIEQLREKVNQLRSNFEKATNLSSIMINVEQTNHIDWNHVIYVEDKSNQNKVRFPCLSANINCPWKGQKDQLEHHLAICAFQPLRLEIDELKAINAQLIEENNECKDRIGRRDAKIEKLKDKRKKDKDYIKTLQDQIEARFSEIRTLQYQVQTQGRQITKQRTEIEQKENQIRTQRTEIEQKENQIEEQQHTIQLQPIRNSNPKSNSANQAAGNQLIFCYGQVIKEHRKVNSLCIT